MRINYVEQKKWVRTGAGYIAFAFLNIILLAFNTFMSGELNISLFALNMVFLVIGTVKGIQYFNLHEKEYIHIDDQAIFIDRGSLVPRKRILFSDIEMAIERDSIIILKLNGDQEQLLYAEWLSQSDWNEVKKVFMKKTNWRVAHVH